MLKIINGQLTETEYCIAEEAKAASILTTGNGYMGVRGSFEEFGSIRVQGIYVRGLFGSIVEVVEPFPDNEYMKNYYFDEQKLKDFERQDSIVNLSDFLLVRIFVDGKPFFPWKGKILSWERSLNASTGELTRKVVWDSGEGDVTEFEFRRFASYENKHKYCQKITVTPVNHDKYVQVISGMDTKVKTCGQKVTEEISHEANEVILQHVRVNGPFGFEAGIGLRNRFYSGKEVLKSRYTEEEGRYAEEVEFKGKGKSLTVEKTVCVWTNRENSDMNAVLQLIQENCLTDLSYQEQFEAHLKVFGKIFAKFDIRVEGDNEADGLLRYANYQTLISASSDAVHSFSAKGLTGEKYNDFVWWDSEIYQLPVFVYTCPELAKQAILYRYNRLEQSKINARQEGYGGVKYAFCSSVTGEEKVWIYARHPFLQIHINADVAFSVINYYRVTGDKEFLVAYGLEMLCEIARYWITRCTFKDGKYQILNVTGTDEHHPYVDNDAYTNYLVRFILRKTVEYIGRFGKDCNGKKFLLSSSEIAQIQDIADKMYLPLEENQMIPQFDGYFDLSRTLPLTEGSSAKSFQMKQSGLYHKSQIIKQPDVILLFNYVCREDDKFTAEQYRLNWDYYEKQCESASSLSFPVHAIASADNGRMRSFYDYLIESVKIDIADLHNCAWQGVHSGCLAGGWLAVYRGLFGIDMLEDGIHFAPNFMPFWSKVSFSFEYKGIRIYAEMKGHKITLKKENSFSVPVFLNGKRIDFAENSMQFNF